MLCCYVDVQASVAVRSRRSLPAPLRRRFLLALDPQPFMGAARGICHWWQARSIRLTTANAGIGFDAASYL